MAKEARVKITNATGKVRVVTSKFWEKNKNTPKTEGWREVEETDILPTVASDEPLKEIKYTKGTEEKVEEEKPEPEAEPKTVEDEETTEETETEEAPAEAAGDITEGKVASDFTGDEAIAVIGKLETKEAIEAFIKDDPRKGVNKAAEKRIAEL